MYNSQYRELLSVVNAQKHQLSALQADVTKVGVTSATPPRYDSVGDGDLRGNIEYLFSRGENEPGFSL